MVAPPAAAATAAEEKAWSRSHVSMSLAALALFSAYCQAPFDLRQSGVSELGTSSPLAPTPQTTRRQWAREPQPADLSDASFLRARVMEEHGWSAERAEGALGEYLRFLLLLAEAPRRELIASSDVDLVWHEHLIDTENYARDCFRLFGFFLHHRRARTAEEFAGISESYQLTKETYAARFGAAPPPSFWGSETTAASMCGGSKSDLDPDPVGPPTPSTPSPSLAPGLTYAPSAPPTPRPDANRATASGASWGAAVLSLASAFAAAALAPISTRRA
eukprot:TRINITY_DN1618_c0_g1_i4.p1 TRINITY_DN1618_c0_g1~~TRINITY_DN1618_c0_g1_i4.p1  ORF type:complete len:294 (-),score=59.51 TRINITY_DN1618_c0_g1_i4:233-1060(-)